MKSQVKAKVVSRMREMGFTRGDMAYITGMGQNTIGSYLREEDIKSTYGLMAISIALNLPMEYIVKEQMDDMRELIVKRRDEVRKSAEYARRMEERKRWRE